MVPTPFSCTRTRKSSRPRSTGRCVPGARPAEVAPGMVKRSPPRLLLWLAWICALLRVLSDGGGCGDGAAGCPAVVVAVGVVGGVGVGVGGGAGGGRVVVRAGAAGGGRPARPAAGAAPPLLVDRGPAGGPRAARAPAPAARRPGRGR